MRFCGQEYSGEGLPVNRISRRRALQLGGGALLAATAPARAEGPLLHSPEGSSPQPQVREPDWHVRLQRLVAPEDYSARSLRHVQRQVLAPYEGSHLRLPLAEKARYYHWELFRYHLTPWHQVHHYTELPEEPGRLPRWIPGSDSSTWNGALLAALAYQVAVTGEGWAVARLEELLQGMAFFLEVTRSPGLLARNVSDRPTPAQPGQLRYRAPDGRVYWYREDSAKGTYNQAAAGLGTVLMLAQDRLSPQARNQAQWCLSQLAMHLVRQDYHITNSSGKRTPYGNLVPLVGSQGVPFNAQVAYMIVALGYHFPPAAKNERRQLAEEFHRLRHKHHVYYESPWRSLVRPQRVGASLVVKGVNDRNHVATAAYVSLLLERWAAARQGRQVDATFVYQMGRTLYWTSRYLQPHRHSLCNFMWAAVVRDPVLGPHLLRRRERAAEQRRVRQLVADGLEQLRHFPLDRFVSQGQPIRTRTPQWVDLRRSDDFQWKADPFHRWQAQKPTGETTCGTDYLLAYWLMRHWRLG